MTMMTLAPLPQPVRKGWLARLFGGRDGARELDALEPRDRCRLRDDTGQSDADLLAIMHARHVNELLPVAMACHGLDAVTLDQKRRDVMHDLQRACAHCGIVRACRRMLADADLEAHRQVCPNAATMEALDR